MRKNTFLTLSLCGMLCVAVSAQAAPLTNFDTWRGAADLGLWRTKASTDMIIVDGGNDFAADWRLYGAMTYGLGGHWGLQYIYHGMASDEDIMPDMRASVRVPGRQHIDYRGSTNELNLVYSLRKDGRAALFIGANRVKNELRIQGAGSLAGTRTHFQGGLTATAPLGHKWDAYGLVGVGSHGLFQGEAGFAYKMKDDWQANIGYRWFRVKDAFDEITVLPCPPEKLGYSVGEIKVRGITFGVTHFFGPGAKKAVPRA